MDLKEKIKTLPKCPGVYLMKDSLDSVIYVGKSKNLKNRVSSYFQNSKFHSPKVEKLVKNLKNFDYILTDTEFEAFLLECKLIKEIKPIYNKLMKNPKSYSYINIKINEKYPTIQVSNEYNESDGSLYWGPYANKKTVERALQGIRAHNKIPCSNNSQKTASSCLNYSLGLCIGFCVDDKSRKQYLGIVNNIVELFNGKDKTIIEEMEYIMNNASHNFDFEVAAKYRDYINALNSLINKVKIIEYIRENKNIVLLEDLSKDYIKLFLINGNEIMFSEKYLKKDFNSQETKHILVRQILSCFRNESLKNLIKVGKDEIDESEIIYTYIKSKSNNCKHIIILDNWLNDPEYINDLVNKLLS